MSFQNIFILGATGQVGSELIKQIKHYDGSDHMHQNPTRIIGVANSTNYILNAGGIDPDKNILLHPNHKEIPDHTYGSYISYLSHEEILNGIRSAGLEGDVIFVDVTADGEKMSEFHKNVILKTNNKIVTANKKPVAGDMSVFETIAANPHRYRYNTTVMAGAGAVPYVQESHGLSEEVQSIEGTFSGTLAYVCSELEKGKKSFSQIVREAKNLGYTEPHPLDDLNGEDVRRKLTILLRSAGVRIEAEDIELSGLVDGVVYSNLDADAFLSAIEAEDDRIAHAVLKAQSEYKVPRYLAKYSSKGGRMIATVGLEFVPVDSELGRLQGTANKILIHTSQRTPTGSAPHIIQSPGAGVVKTAASVRADLLYLLHGTNLWQHN